jgi:hypothetical protein
MRWLALTLWLAACAGGDLVDTPRSHDTAPPSYEEVVRQRVEAVGDAATHTLRFNPTSCRCPAFEIALGDRWQRVDLAVDDPDDATLLTLLEAVKPEPDQVSRTYTVEGALTDVLGTCGAGTLFVTLEPAAFVKGTPESAP